MKSFLDCNHPRADGYTCECPDCGYNVWMTNEDYLKDLRRKVGKFPDLSEIRALEKKLGIGEKITPSAGYLKELQRKLTGGKNDEDNGSEVY